MAESCHSKTISASAKVATGDCYLWGFTVTQNAGAALAIFDDSTGGAGTEKIRGATVNTAGACTVVTLSKPIHFATGIYVTITTATVSIVWEGPAS
jgi:hypothetical protein